MVMHVVGELSAIFILSQVAFVLALIGLALGLGGYLLLRATLIPILFLLFAIPMPYFIRFDDVVSASAHFVRAGSYFH